MNRILLRRSLLRVLTAAVGLGGIVDVSHAADPAQAVNLSGTSTQATVLRPFDFKFSSGWSGVGITFGQANDTATTEANYGDYLSQGIPEIKNRDGNVKDKCGWVGDPIVYSTGNIIVPQNDFAAAGEMGLTFNRTYNMYWNGIGILGNQWITSFDSKLLLTTADPFDLACYPVPGTSKVCDATDKPIWAQRTDGRKIKFNYVGGSPKMWVEDRASPVAAIILNSDGTYTLSTEERTIETYDKSGFPLKVLNEPGVGWTFTWTSNHLLTKVTHSSGRAVTLTWTGSRLTSITDPAGNVFQYAYVGTYSGTGTTNNVLSKVTWPGVANTANGGTPVTTIDFQYGGTASFLTGVSYNGVKYSSFQYDGNLMGTLTTEANGINQFTVSYASDGGDNFYATTTNPLGLSTKYSYNKGKLVSTTGYASANCPARQSSTSYDANGNRDLVTDYRGIVTDYDYDAKGHLQQIIENATAPVSAVDRRTTVNGWDANDRLVRSTIAGYRQTDTTYTGNGRLASVVVTTLGNTGGSGRTLATGYAYTTGTNGIVTKTVITGPTPGSAVTYNYNSLGDLTSVVDALGRTTSYGNYNGLGLPGSVTDPNGDVTSFTYDPLGRIASSSKTVNGAAQITRTTYDAFGNITKIATPDGREITNVYDAAYRLTRTEEVVLSSPSAEAPGNIDTTTKQTIFTYNVNSDITSVTKQLLGKKWYLDPGCDTSLLNVSAKLTQAIAMAPPVCTPKALTSTVVATKTFLDYDELGRLIGTRGNNGQNVRQSYDANGNVASITDSAGKTTTFGYDALNRQNHVADAVGGHTWMSYDLGNQVSSVTDPRGLITQYGYDGFGQLWSQTSPDTGTTTYAYDAFGRRTGITRANGKASGYGYDGLDRVTTVSAAGQTQSFNYDSCSNGIGRLCSVSDPSGTTSYTYTPQGWISGQSVTPTGFAGHNLSYSYDGVGRVVGMDYDSGLHLAYAYSAGRIATVSATIQGTTRQIFSTYYDGADQLYRMTFGNQVYRSVAYDLDGRPTSLTASLGSNTIQQMTYGWDSRDRIASITNNLYTALTQTFTYDDLARLTGVTSPIFGTQGMIYDANGNRTQQSWSTTEAVTLTAGTNWLATRGAITFGHDAAGNRLSRNQGGAVTTYAYDPFNRLSSVSQSNATVYCEASSNSCPGPVYAAGTTNYQVNALGQRVSKNGPKGAYTYTYAQDGRLAIEVSPAGTTYYVYANGEPIALVRSNALYYPLNDHLGRPESVTNSAGAVVWRAENYAFDRKVVLNGLPDLDIGLPGQVYDGETGHWNNGFRDYDPQEGRYVQSDPIGLAGGNNTYAYVGGNPLSRIDFTGLACNNQGCWNTPQERAYAQAGDWKNYYATACAGGDSYACEGSKVANNIGILSGVTNYRLAMLISDHLPSGESCAVGRKIVARKMEAIRKALVAARANQLDLAHASPINPVRVSGQSIADFHNEIFRAIAGGSVSSWGIPVFGGDIPLSNAAADWCVEPACHP